MSHRILIATLFTFAAFLSDNTHAQEKREVRYELQVYRLDGVFRSKTSLAKGIVKPGELPAQKTKGAVTLFNEGQFDWSKQQLKLGSKGCFWNGKKLTFEEGYRAKLPDGKLKMIYSPTVKKRLGEMVRLKIESDTPFQYMERQDDASFALKEITLPVGLDLKVRAKDGQGGRFLIEHFEIELRSVGSREKIPGVSLPIGKPASIQRLASKRLRCSRPSGRNNRRDVNPNRGF